MRSPRRFSLNVRLLLGLFGSCLCALPTWASAQVRPVIVPSRPECPDCRVERHLVATVQDTAFEGGAIGIAAATNVNEDGSFLVITGAGIWTDELYWADPSGTIVRRIGRTGEGPGEFVRPLHVVELPAAYWVIDTGAGRITQLDKRTLAFETTYPLRGGVSGADPVAVPGGGILTWGTRPTRESAGFGLHYISADGDVVRSFGPTPQGDNPALALSGDGDVWLGFDDYRIEKWSLDGGHKVAELRRTADWVRPRTEETEEGGRYSALVGLYQDAEGRIWTHTIVRTLGIPHSDPSAVESILEVLDPVRGVVIARERSPGLRDMTIGGGHGLFRLTYRSLPSGQLLRDVWATELIPPPVP